MMTGNYPLLTEMMQEMALDNYGNLTDEFLKPEDEWEWPDNAEFLEQQASELTEDERIELCAGEDGVIQRIIKRRDCNALWDFTCHVFDGHLHRNFYYD